MNKYNNYKKTTNTLKKTLSFVGFMGAGKTTIGYLIAKYYKVPFFDVDKEIEIKNKITIAEIFKTKGEEYFRNLEYITIKDIIENNSPCVISTGGGAFLNKDSFKILQTQTTTLWLKSSLKLIKKRVSRNRQKRPLVNKENWEQEVQDLLIKRTPTYAKAHFVVPTYDEPTIFTINRCLRTIKNITKEKK